MNYDDLTEEQFDCMAEELCAAWRTLEQVRKEVEGHGLPDSVFKAIRYRQQGIAKTLDQDPIKEPQWPPVRKWKVGLTQRRVIEFIAEIEVEATDEYEAEQLAREQTEDWAHHHKIEWEESQESACDERELDDETWCCEPV
jgi:hypothetical protein